MKNLIIVAIIVGVLAIGTVMAINIGQPMVKTTEQQQEQSCGCPSNECTTKTMCGQSTCEMKTIGTCGCEK